MPRTVTPMAFWAGLSKLRKMACSRPHNDVVLAYARRLDAEAWTWDEVQTMQSVFAQSGLSVIWSEQTLSHGATLRIRDGVEWINNPGIHN